MLEKIFLQEDLSLVKSENFQLEQIVFFNKKKEMKNKTKVTRKIEAIKDFLTTVTCKVAFEYSIVV